MSAGTHDRYLSVTELAGEKVAGEQIERMADRYAWAAGYCSGKDVVEVACGTGQGLGLLSDVAACVVGGDISPQMVAQGRAHYGNRVEILEFNAEHLPFPDHSKDVVIILEAIYYLPNVKTFLDECRRVLRSTGQVLIATANKDLPDFNPSPFSNSYFGIDEFSQVLDEAGFTAEYFGNTPLEEVSIRQRMLRPAKALAVKLNLMPKTMAGKKLLKRVVFGSLQPMPAEISGEQASGTAPAPLRNREESLRYKVLFCAATLR